MRFQEDFNEMKREVLDLKTAQKKGFGSLNFYKKSVNYTHQPSQQFLHIEATAKAGETTPFFAQLSFSGTEDLIAQALDASGSRIRWSFFFYNVSAVNFTFTVISTSDFMLTAGSGQ